MSAPFAPTPFAACRPCPRPSASTARRAALLLAALATGAPALAVQDSGPPANAAPPRDDYALTFGLGAAVNPSYAGSNDYQVNPGGIIRGRVAGFAFQTQGLGLLVDLIRDGSGALDVQAGPVVALNPNRVNRIQDRRVAALGELDLAVEVGGYLGLSKTGIVTSPYDSLTMTVVVRRDVTGTHDSHVIEPRITYATPLDRRTLVALSVDTTIVGQGFARTYFGVTPQGAAASGLAAYDLGGGVQDVGLNLIGVRSLGRDVRRGWALFGIAGFSRILGDFARSPVVGDAGSPNQFFSAMGLAYSF